MKTLTRTLIGCGLLALAFAAAPRADGQAAPADAPLPGSSPVIDVSSPEQALYRIAVPDLGGTAGLGAQGAGVLRSDFALVSLFKVLDPASFVANLASEGLSISPPSWQTVGAQGVIKGDVRQVGGSVSLTMHFFEIARG